MSNRAKTCVAVAALVAMVVAFGGTAQAAPTVYTVNNYNFQDALDSGIPDGGFSGRAVPPDYWFPASGAGYPYNYREWNPTSTSFATAGGNGVLPGTAAGSQCLTNTATYWDETDVMLVTGNMQGTYGAAVVPNLQPNMRYTVTAAIGSALNATINNGVSLFFADIKIGALVAEHGDMLPNGLTNNGTGNGSFLNSGTFGDTSFSLAANDIIGLSEGGGKIIAAGDGLSVGLSLCAGVNFSNIRVISQNWQPLYVAGNVSWANKVWSPTTGGPYNNSNWVPGQDAVFEGNGGTVTVGSDVTVNSLNFATSDIDKYGNIAASTGSYTLSGAGKITLTGDAIITTGAGTNNNVGEQGDVGPALGTYNNPGGGTNTIACVLAGSAGMYKAGGGTLILTAGNIYTGGTTVGGGTLQLGNGTTNGSIQGDVLNQANLAFNPATTSTFSGNLLANSTGSVDILGTHTTIFTGATNADVGVTTIHSGATLQIGSGGTTGSIGGDVVNNSALTFNRSNTLTYGGVIYGAGTVTQQGTGRVIFTGVNKYTGATNVQSGALQINGATTTTNVLTNSGGANVTGGFLILDYNASGVSVASTVQSILQTAYGHGFTNTGDHIYDTAASSSVGLGWVDNAATKQITIMPALYGDCTLDGTVGLADLNVLLSNYGKSNMNWSQGDFTYDGTVGLADLNVLLSNYSKSGPLNIANAPYPNLDSQALSCSARMALRSPA